VSTEHENGIIHCIALARFLLLPEFTILGIDDVPEYSDFKTDAWTDYLSDTRRNLTNEFRQELNTHSIYEKNSKKEYVRAQSLAPSQGLELHLVHRNSRPKRQQSGISPLL
jgi:hypothetical protein